MIAFITGTIQDIGKDFVMIVTGGGVGYKVSYQLPATSYQLGDTVSLHTYLKVSDNAMDLYGFQSKEEREFFELLLTVSGVGPKTARHIMSLGSLAAVQEAIGRGDVKYLTAVQGIGKKTAERLVVELKSKIPVQGGSPTRQGKDTNAETQALADVIDGLVALGYEKNQARTVVMALEISDRSTEAIMRAALQHMR